MQSSQDLAYQLMDFRANYLRAVARAAVDLDFRRILTSPDRNPLKTLRDHFGYACPWDLTLVLKDNPELGPRLNVANGTVMTQPNRGETITIFIPNKPRDADPVTVMDALAAYYDLTPLLLPHRDPNRDAAQREPYDPVADSPRPPPDAAAKWFSVDMLRDTNARFDLGVAVEHFVSFAACMFNAVALAWSNDHFKTLLTDPGSKEPASGLLQTWLGYKYPWWLDLQVRIDPDARFVYDNAPANSPVKKGKWNKIKAPQLTLTLPWMTGASNAEQETELNKSNTNVTIMGLALYNTDGAGYPFTCG